MAGTRLLEELTQSCPDYYDISVFGDDPHGSYNRIMLSPVLAGEKTLEEITLLPFEWYQEHGVALFTGAGGKVEQINRHNKTIDCADGQRHSYDRLVLCTGSQPFMLPIEGIDLEGVVSFRDIADVETMIAASQQCKKAVVIGAGLLGLEAAMGLTERGMEVTVVNRANYPLNRQLDEEAGQCLQAQLEAKGLKFELDANTVALHSDDKSKGSVKRVELEDGRMLEADLVVMAIGIVPNIALAQSAELHCERGIVVSDVMQSFDPSIYALGECIQHRGETFGLVAPLYEQAKVLTNHLSEHGVAQYQSLPTATQLKVTGIQVFSVGQFLDDGSSEALIFRDARAGIYKKLVIKDGCLVGAVMIGDSQEASFYKELVESKRAIQAIRPYLMFGRALCESNAPIDTRDTLAEEVAA